MMKKRLLALALCLVMMTSLLPLTAAAYTEEELSSSTNIAYCGDTYFKLNFPLGRVSIEDEEGNEISTDSGRCMLPSGKDYHITYSDGFGNNQNKRISILNHNWQFTKTENSLTASCRNPEDYKKEGGTCKCSVGETSLTLDAHSVTLPDSPFNARLAGEKEFQAAFPNAAISTIRYDYRGSDGVWHKDVNPVAANAKAGEYQAFVQITGLPGPVESDGPVAMAENPDGIYTAELYVHYTAADPAVTAQTGDDRPIELMLVCALAFSALAAAAFILDSKRKYSR